MRKEVTILTYGWSYEKTKGLLNKVCDVDVDDFLDHIYEEENRATINNVYAEENVLHEYKNEMDRLGIEYIIKNPIEDEKESFAESMDLFPIIEAKRELAISDEVQALDAKLRSIDIEMEHLSAKRNAKTFNAETLKEALENAEEWFEVHEDKISYEIVKEVEKSFFKKAEIEIIAKINDNAISSYTHKLELQFYPILEKRKRLLENAYEIKMQKEEEKRNAESEKRHENQQKELDRMEEIVGPRVGWLKKLSEYFPSYIQNTLVMYCYLAKPINTENNHFDAFDFLCDLLDAFECGRTISKDNPIGTNSAVDTMIDRIMRRHLPMEKYYQEFGDVINEVQEQVKTAVKIHLSERFNYYISVNFLDTSMYDWKNYPDLNDTYNKMKDSFASEADFCSQIMSKFIPMMYSVVLLEHDYNNSLNIKDNEELLKIVLNSNRGTIMLSSDEDIYNIYKLYYEDVFPELLSEEEFRNRCNVIKFFNKREHSIDIMQSALEIVDVNIDKIINEAKERKDSGETFYQYIEKNYLESGRFDVLMESDNHSKLFDYLICVLNYKLIDVLSLDSYFVGLFEAQTLSNHESVYYKKYKLLHDETDEIDRIKNIKKHLQDAVTGVDFENVLKELYEQMGYKVETTKTTGDQGADLIVEKDNIRAVIQAKYYSSSVGNSAVQEVVAAKNYYGAQKGIVITNNTFTKAACELAEANGVQLIDGEKLNSILSMLV